MTRLQKIKRDVTACQCDLCKDVLSLIAVVDEVKKKKLDVSAMAGVLEEVTGEKRVDKITCPKCGTAVN